MKKKITACIILVVYLISLFVSGSALTIILDLNNTTEDELVLVRELIDKKLESFNREGNLAEQSSQESDLQNVRTITVPDVSNIEAEEAKTILQNRGISVKTTSLSSDSVKDGYVVKTYPKAGTQIDSDQIVTLYVSKGSIYASHSTVTFWNALGSYGDTHEFIGSPRIAGDTLIIKLNSTINSNYVHKWRNFGTAAVNDTFDKVVPIEVEFESEDVVRGEAQEISIKIPLQNLNVQKPTTISVKLEMYYGSKNREESLRMDFTFAW